MNTNNISNSPLQNQNMPSVQGKEQKELGQQDFLRLMVAQVQHQDPMQPNASGDFIGQLAQFSTNDGIQKMQKSMEYLADSFQSNQALQASSLVGRKVLVPHNKFALGEEGGVKMNADLPAPVTDLVAEIYGENGELINKIPLGSKNAGLFAFEWDGQNSAGERAPQGSYKVLVKGRYENQEVGIKTLTAANVDSVSLGFNGEGFRLNVAGIGSVPLYEVRQVTI